MMQYLVTGWYMLKQVFGKLLSDTDLFGKTGLFCEKHKLSPISVLLCQMNQICKKYKKITCYKSQSKFRLYFIMNLLVEGQVDSRLRPLARKHITMY